MHIITQKKYKHMKRPPATLIEHDTETKGCCEGNSKKGTTLPANEGTAIVRETRPTPASREGGTPETR